MYSAALDLRRFSTLDSVLFGPTSFIGDGIVSGWEIVPGAFPAFSVTKGGGFIDGFYVTTENDEIFDSTTISPSSTYHIYAKRIAGLTGDTGNPSDLLVANVVDTTTPAIPSSFTVISPDSNLVVVSADMVVELDWDDNVEVDFDHYSIYRSPNGTDFDLLSSANSSVYTDTDVEETTSYWYRVSAVDKSLNESGFATGTVTTPQSLVKIPSPKNFNVFASDGCVDLVWEQPATLSLSEIASYRISYSELDTDNSILNTNTFDVSNSTWNAKIGSLKNSVKYQVSIRTVDIRNRISSGLIKTVLPQRDVAPPDPVSLSATQKGSETGPNSVKLFLTWLPGGTEYESAENINYRIYFTIDGIKNTQESSYIETSIDQFEIEIEAVPFPGENVAIPENSLVTVRITSVSLDRNESKGSYLRLKTNIYTGTQALRNVTTSYDIRTIRVQWNNNPDTYQIRIKVEKRDLDGEPYEDLVFVSEEVVGRIWIYVISLPDLGFAYYISLTPINKNGIEGPTTTVSQNTFRSNELDFPERPSKLYGMSQYKTVQLEWAEPTNNLIKNYRLYRSESRYSFDFDDYTLLDTLSLGTTHFVDFGLREGQTYTYYITSVDVFNRETPHLANEYSNVGMIAIDISVYEGKLSAVSNATLTISGFDVVLTWDIVLGDPFDSFRIMRSIGNLFSFETITLVDYQLNQVDYSYTDTNILTESNVNYYYIIQKVSNDATFSVLTSKSPPANSIYLGSVSLSNSEFTNVNISGRRIIKNLEDTLGELTIAALLQHRHFGLTSRVATKIKDVWYFLDSVYAEAVDLNPSLVVTNWATVDGKIFTTTKDISGGSIYSLKVNGLFSEILFDVDEDNGRLVFAESIIPKDKTTGVLIGTANLELTVYGIEETSNILPSFRFDNLNAQQIGYSRLAMSQIPSLSHEGRLNEKLIPKRQQLTRYDNHTFVFSDSELNAAGLSYKDLFGDGITFFAITDKTSEITKVSDFDDASILDIDVFQNPSYSSATQNNIISGSTAQVVMGQSFSGTNSYKVTFQFTDDNEGRWVRLTTVDFNPIVSIRSKLSIRMMIESGSFYFGLGIRKSYVSHPVIGENGGTSFSDGQDATIEFVGVTQLLDSSIDHPDVPTPQGKYLVNAKPGSWQTFEFDIPNEAIFAYTGNGSLSTTNGYATLEHLNFTVNPDYDNPTEEIIVYIDDIIQLDDAIAASTNQGIRKSSDYGHTWELVRYVDSPIHKFYKATHNTYLWGISPKHVYFSTDVNSWFELPGTKGVQYIRDICEDNNGNMYVSTDRGVFLLLVGVFATFSEFRQTQPVTPFSSECYAIWNDNGAIRVSTEMGIFETTNLGITWTETSLQGIVNPLFQIIQTASGALALSSDSVFRRLNSESQFLEIADLPIQTSTVSEIWKASFFNNNLYLSTNDGIYQNQLNNMFEVGVPTTIFDRVFSSIEKNSKPEIAYSLDVIGEDLWIGCENVLYSSDDDNQITTKLKLFNKEAPTISINNVIKEIGFVYGSFNGVIGFRESVEPNSIIKVDFLPRRIYLTENGGWAQSNIKSPIIVRYNGEPKWIDFTLNEASVTSFVTSAKTSLQEVEDRLTSYNSNVSSELLNRTYASADLVLEGTIVYDAAGQIVSTSPLINKRTVAEFLKNYSLTVSSINASLLAYSFPVASFNSVGTDTATRTDTEFEVYGSLSISELPYTDTLSQFISYADFKNTFESGYLESELLGRAKLYDLTKDSLGGIAIQNILTILDQHRTTISINIQDAIEDREQFQAESSKGITLNLASGIADFTSLNISTSVAERNKFKFIKEDELTISILGSIIDNSETMTHSQIEDQLDLVNSGMTASLAANAHGNLIKGGIVLERKHPYSFETLDVQNIQSRYYPGTRADWYDQINSTIDYNVLIQTSSLPVGRIPFSTHWFNEDAYFNQRLWVGTDRDIFEYTIESDGSIEFIRIISPSGTTSEIRSIEVRNDDEIYVIAGDKIYLSLNFGNSWQEVSTTNLPDYLYKLTIVNNNLLTGTNQGVWWKGDAYDEFSKSSLSFSELLSNTEKTNSEIAFVSSISNIETRNFTFMESNLEFFLSQDGTSFVALGPLDRYGVKRIGKLYYYKSLLWVATDKGLFNDGGTILSEKIEFNLQPILGTLYDSQVAINDVVGSVKQTSTSQEILYACSSSGKIYQLHGEEWKEYNSELSTIHKMVLIEDYDTIYIAAIGYDKISIIPITRFSEGDVNISEIEPCLD